MHYHPSQNDGRPNSPHLLVRPIISVKGFVGLEDPSGHRAQEFVCRRSRRRLDSVVGHSFIVDSFSFAYHHVAWCDDLIITRVDILLVVGE